MRPTTLAAPGESLALGSVELSLVAIILGTAASFTLGICAAALTSRVTRRPSETILTPHKGYGLVEEKRSPDSVIVEML